MNLQLLCSIPFKDMAGFKKPDFPKNPKYTDTRLSDVYQVKKSRLQLISGKESAKKQENLPVDKNCSTKNIFLNSAAYEQPAVCVDKLLRFSEDVKDDAVQGCTAADNHNENTFRTVAKLQLGNERLHGQTVVNMDKALKGLVAAKPPAFSSVSSDSSKCCGNLISNSSTNLCPDLIVPGHKCPLDLTLKTHMRVVSSSSVGWFHRSIMGSTYNGMAQVCMLKGDSVNQEVNLLPGFSSCSQISKPKAVYSWVYPQSSLPPSVISAFTLAASEGAEMDFLSKRHSAWEDAFRCLYYMLRKNACNIFYVCAAQFVVMFASSCGKGKAKISCNAYISKSTRGLRSLLKEHDVCFSMPLCPSRMEEATMEDLVELSEIEKQNLGQTRRLSSSSDVDGTPKSLLAFGGNQNVHSLYDFMLNYRSFLPTLTGADVPMLYSPVMFPNASIHIPEIQCKELKKLDHTTLSLSGPGMKNWGDQEILSGAKCYSIEVRDMYLPPWITCNLCAIMGSEGRDFEASFTTERTSAGLNVALETLIEKSEESKVQCMKDAIHPFGIVDAVVAPEMYSAVLKGLKYCHNSFAANLSRI
uniref:Protein downstream neighbor of Son n=1 Tax=Kalanchoe fedtschenkoi TaxID=63787 RepID=A0A7N0V4X5_KALFE